MGPCKKALLKTNHPTLISFPFGGKLARQRGIETHSLGGYDATFLESPPLWGKTYPYPMSFQAAKTGTANSSWYKQ